jgi:hypothetical protein
MNRSEMDEKRNTREIPDLPPAEMPLVHFTIRQMLLFVAGVSGVCMILVSLEGYAAVIFGVSVVLVAGHVLSTMIGSRLRANADATSQWELRQTAVPPRPVLEESAPVSLGRSQLQVRTACSQLLWWFVGLAMVGGALSGALALQYIAGPTVGWSGKFIGAVSSAMVVGWAALILAGICGIARRSWRAPGGESEHHRA